MAAITQTWNNVDPDKKWVLFLAPNPTYAQVVVRNTKKDLDKANIKYESYSGYTKGTPFIQTDHIRVDFLYTDPVTWTTLTLSGYNQIFGEKKLLRTVREKFPKCNYPIETISVQKYIIDMEYSDWCDPLNKPRTTYLPEITNVYFNDPVTVVMWEDGTKTMVRCKEGDVYSPEVGLSLCITKKSLGNMPNFNNIFRKWCPKEEEAVTVDVSANSALAAACDDLKAALKRNFGKFLEDLG